MNYTVCSREKDLMSIMWNVFASFGYKDAVETEGNGVTSDKIGRFAIDNGLKSKIILSGTTSAKAMAEMVSVTVEAAAAVDFPEFSVNVCCPEEVKELLYLFSIDEYCVFEYGNFSLEGKSGDTVLFRGCIDESGIVCEFDLVACSEAMNDANLSAVIPETIVYAEKNAEGIGYEVAYIMRMSGCLVTNYLGVGDISSCEKYAKDNNVESIIRVYPDGKIQIKETGSGTVTETDYDTFTGYYDDLPEEDEHEHHHECECGCGHDHNHDGHTCKCGHSH